MDGEERLFTQEEVNDIVQQRLARERKKSQPDQTRQPDYYRQKYFELLDELREDDEQ